MIKSIYAIMERWYRKFFSKKISLISLVSLPSIIIITNLLGIDKFLNLSIGIKYTQFLIPGLLCVYIVNNSATLGYILMVDLRDFMKLIKTAPISRASIVLGYIFAELSIQMISFLIFIILYFLYVRNISIYNLLLTILYLPLFSIGFFAFAMCLAYFVKDGRVFGKIFSIMLGLMYLFSGVFYPLNSFPKVIRYAAYLNPVTYGADMFRYLLAGVHEISFTIGLIFIIIFSIAGLLMSIILIKKK